MIDFINDSEKIEKLLQQTENMPKVTVKGLFKNIEIYNMGGKYFIKRIIGVGDNHVYFKYCLVDNDNELVFYFNELLKDDKLAKKLYDNISLSLFDKINHTIDLYELSFGRRGITKWSRASSTSERFFTQPREDRV